MTIREVLQHPDERLRLIAAPVGPITEAVLAVCDDPKTRLCYELCAPQFEDRGVFFLKKQSPVTKQGEQPWYFEPVPGDLISAEAARKWQALAAFVDSDAEALRLVAHCNKEPHLNYTWEA